MSALPLSALEAVAALSDARRDLSSHQPHPPRPSSPGRRPGAPALPLPAASMAPPVPASFAVPMPTEAVRCARGHHIPRHALPTPAAGLRCDHQDRGGTCTEWLWVYTFARGTMCYVFRQTKQEVDAITRREQAPEDTLRALLGY